LGLGVRGSVRIGATVAGCALVAACTPNQPPASTSTPPDTATASPTGSATPTETDIERQMRLDWEAAEKAYRSAISEGDRLAREGGASKATPTLRAVSTGEFLELQLLNLRVLKSRGWRFEGGVTIISVRRDGGWHSTELNLLSCEDNSSWRVFDRHGRDVTPQNQPDYVQSLTVKKVGNAWKVSDVYTKKVKNVAEKDCAP
jgi:hypothetical protein